MAAQGWREQVPGAVEICAGEGRVGLAREGGSGTEKRGSEGRRGIEGKGGRGVGSFSVGGERVVCGGRGGERLRGRFDADHVGTRTGRERYVEEVGKGLHGEEREVAAVVVVLEDAQLAQLGKLNLEGVAAAIQHVGELLQLALGCGMPVIQDGVLHESLRTGLVDEHANALDAAKLGANLYVKMENRMNRIEMT